MATAGNPLDAPTINAMIARDAAQLVEMRYTFEQRYNDFNQNYSQATQLTALGITAATDQANITALYGAFSRLVQWMTAATPLPAAQDMLYAARGVLWLSGTSALASQIKSDAATLLQFWRWLSIRSGEWDQNANTAALLNLYNIYDSNAQQQILAVQGVMHNCLTVLTAGVLASAVDMMAPCRAVLGVS